MGGAGLAIGVVDHATTTGNIYSKDCNFPYCRTSAKTAFFVTIITNMHISAQQLQLEIRTK